MRLTKSSLHTIATLFMAAAALIPFSAQAVSSSDKPQSLEESIRAADQRRADTFTDLNRGVILTYKDSVSIDSVDSSLVDVVDSEARILVNVKYSIDFNKAKGIIPTLKKYFETSTDKEEGVEPFSTIGIRLSECKGYDCKDVASRIMRNTGVGISVSFLGEEDLTLINDPGNFKMASGTLPFIFVVQKSRIKGDPKPVAKSQVINISRYSLRHVGQMTDLSRQIVPMTERCLDILDSGVSGADCTPGNPAIIKVDRLYKMRRF